jgi:hypothetical protein
MSDPLKQTPMCELDRDNAIYREKQSENLVLRARDGFIGSQIGTYVTREGVEGVVLQQVGTSVVHVYRKTSVEVTTKEQSS